ncbi:Multidrug transporter DTR1 [Fulvia fulva]|uniref:Multidrug transporter DTR1 n=1 Tax=Passalora fulva TaxID=5499 RepID=A0A9Q8PHK5_PASFU|nr:Multidrug transporter DTR1 [Fulvia fulva]KAK4628330.1 Multidrug transporter DTR1 [Fulvia fulva]UJO22552.1 Multidrug transporter DTR1 [Fulvia fulva]WPV29027.1 Multidrug transporter DTR1 [Fulvia fulva]
MAALPPNFGALVFLRVVQAFGSAAVVSMGAGTVADTTEPKHRGKAMSHFLLGPQLGPVIGPVLGGALAEASWRWISGFLALTGFTLWLMIVFALPETLRCRVGNSQINTKSWFVWPPRLATETAPPEEQGPKPPKPTLQGYWKLFSYPPIGIVSFNTAILYAAYFSIAVDLPRSFKGAYGWSESEVGAAYLAVGVALIVGSLVGGRVNDWRRRVMHAKSGDAEVAPESRLVDQIWGVVLCAGGTLMYGWFVDRRIHPAAVLVATFITGFSMSWVFVSSTAFLTECAPMQAAGAFALGNMLRNPAAAIAAVITPSLIRDMGIGWFFTGFALLDLVVVGSSVLILRWRSPYWRAKKKAAAKAAT